MHSGCEPLVASLALFHFHIPIHSLVGFGYHYVESTLSTCVRRMLSLLPLHGALGQGCTALDAVGLG